VSAHAIGSEVLSTHIVLQPSAQVSRQKSRLLPATDEVMSEKKRLGDFFPIQ
jgi:hypothetical protein